MNILATILSETEGLILLLIFGIAMYLAVWISGNKEKNADGFLVADREVSVFRGAMSIAVSWIWAPAIFICALQAYTKGVPGIFWFTFPNILCFFIFTPLAIRLRKLMPMGYSLPHYIVEKRFQGDKKVHIAYLAVFFGYQLGAIVINSLAGGNLLHAISGIDVRLAIVLFAMIPLIYTLGTGLKASIFTDVIQMSMVLVICLLLVPWALSSGAGFSGVAAGLGGIDGTHSSLFDAGIAFTMGIPMTLGLIAGPIGDQMFFQRAMATRPDRIAKTFIYGGLLFGVVPIILSLLGFMAVPLVKSGAIVVSDPQLVGLEVIKHLLPIGAVYAFTFMAFAGLCSTLDSSFCAVSSLGAVDIYKRYQNPNANDQQIVKVSRVWMALITLLGTSIALMLPQLLWVFLIYGALASAGMFPTILAIYWKRLPAWGAFWAIILSLAVGTPLSIYANIKEDPTLVVIAAVASVAIGLVVCLIAGFTSKVKPYES